MDFNPSTAESLAPIAQSSGSNIIVGGGNQIGNIIDVRKYSGYYLSLDAIVSGAGTVFNQIQVALFWTADLAGVTRIYADSFSFWADALSGVGVSLGTVFAQDVMHGPYLRMNLFNVGSDPVGVQWRLLGTTRTLPGPYVRQGNFPDGLLVSEMDNIPVGGELDIPAPLAYGAAQLITNNQGANTMSIKMDYGAAGSDLVTPVLAAGALQILNLVLPKRGAIIVINGTAGQAVTNRLITQYTKA